MSHQQAEPHSHLLRADTASGPGGVEDESQELARPPQLAVHASLHWSSVHQTSTTLALPRPLH